MWIIAASKYNPGDQPELAPQSEDEGAWSGFDDAERPSMFEVRLHGNPLFDTGTAGWQHETAGKRAENDYYRDAYAGADADQFEIKRWFAEAPGKLHHIQGSFCLIDVDDPELVEHGEEYIHERLTSHVADIYVQPEDTWEPWVADCKKYSDDLFFNNLARGYADVGPIVSEAIRQHLGLPYQWMGAQID